MLFIRTSGNKILDIEPIQETIDINYLESYLNYESKQKASPTFLNFLKYLFGFHHCCDIGKEEGCIIVNEEINIDFSKLSRTTDFSNFFDFKNIIFCEKINIDIGDISPEIKAKMNAKELCIDFYTEIQDEFKFVGCEDVVLSVINFYYFKTDSHLVGKIIFQNCSFEYFNMSKYVNKFDKELVFRNCKFKNKLNFANFRFCGETIFEDSEFYKDVDFQNSFFKNYVNFNKCKFEKAANFYGVTFENVINFSQADFKGSLNLVNTNLEFGFYELRSRIQDSKTANDFRDSFRLFKSVLIKEHNNLDASNFHKLELYCKEIGLIFTKPVRDWIDYFALIIYRHISDHHTNLFKILSCIITLIAVCGLALFRNRYKYDLKEFMNTYENNLLFFNNLVSFVQSISENGIEIMMSLLDLYFVFIIYVILNAFWPYSKLKVFNSKIFIRFSKILRFYMCNVLVLCGIPIMLCMVFVAPQYILGVGGFIGGKIYSSGAWDNAILVVYSILLVLLVFSLQKTAHKNSIIPS